MLRPALVSVMLCSLCFAARAQDALPQLALDPPAPPAATATATENWRGFSIGDAVSVSFGDPYAEPGSIAAYFGQIHVHVGYDLGQFTPLTSDQLATPAAHGSSGRAKSSVNPAANFKAAGYASPGFNFTITPSLFVQMGVTTNFRH